MLVKYDGRLYLQCYKQIGRARMNVIFNALTKSAMLDNISVKTLDNHDNIFKPKNIYEKMFWEESRKLTKRTVQSIEWGKIRYKDKKVIDCEKEI